MKNIAIIGENNIELANSLCGFFTAKEVEIYALSPDAINNNSKRYDLIIIENMKDFKLKSNDNSAKIIHVHPSILPAFYTDNAIKEAFLSGVKVSGVTIYSQSEEQTYNIIAQYPVLIALNSHLDEFKKDVLDVEKKLLPAVSDAILNDKVFDFHDLFKKSCAHSSNGCTNCSRG